jgi:Ras-related protein Rab-21
MATYDCKIVTLGEGRVGKTSISLKFVKNEFHNNEISTVSANCLKSTIPVQGGVVNLNIWDTAGQERFRALASNYYRQAKGAVVVYDITDRNSFDKVVSWIKELKDQGEKNIVIVVAGNKCDMEKERQINRAEAMEFCRKLQIKHFDTSAKTGNGVNEIFTELASLIYEANKGNLQLTTKSRSRKGGKISINKADLDSNKKKKCC